MNSKFHRKRKKPFTAGLLLFIFLSPFQNSIIATPQASDVTSKIQRALGEAIVISAWRNDPTNRDGIPKTESALNKEDDEEKKAKLDKKLKDLLAQEKAAQENIAKLQENLKKRMAEDSLRGKTTEAIQERKVAETARKEARSEFDDFVKDKAGLPKDFDKTKPENDTQWQDALSNVDREHHNELERLRDGISRGHEKVEGSERQLVDLQDMATELAAADKSAATEAAGKFNENLGKGEYLKALEEAGKGIAANEKAKPFSEQGERISQVLKGEPDPASKVPEMPYDKLNKSAQKLSEVGKGGGKYGPDSVQPIKSEFNNLAKEAGASKGTQAPYLQEVEGKYPTPASTRVSKEGYTLSAQGENFTLRDKFGNEVGRMVGKNPEAGRIIFEGPKGEYLTYDTWNKIPDSVSINKVKPTQASLQIKGAPKFGSPTWVEGFVPSPPPRSPASVSTTPVAGGSGSRPTTPTSTHPNYTYSVPQSTYRFPILGNIRDRIFNRRGFTGTGPEIVSKEQLQSSADGLK